MTCFIGPRNIGLPSIAFQFALSLKCPVLFILPLWIPEVVPPEGDSYSNNKIPLNIYPTSSIPHPRLISLFRDLPANSEYTKTDLTRITFKFVQNLTSLSEYIFSNDIPNSNIPSKIFILNFSDFFVHRIYLLFESVHSNQNENLSYSPFESQNLTQHEEVEYIFNNDIFRKMLFFITTIQVLKEKTFFLVDEFHSDIAQYLPQRIKYTDECIKKLIRFYSRFFHIERVLISRPVSASSVSASSLCSLVEEEEEDVNIGLEKETNLQNRDSSCYSILENSSSSFEWKWNINKSSPKHLEHQIMDSTSYSRNESAYLDGMRIKKNHGRIRFFGAFE